MTPNQEQGTLFPEEEVSEMKYFKIVRQWSVKAESEAEAFKLVAAAPQEYLDSESITRTEYRKKPQQKSGGWGNAIKDQLLGNSNSRKT
jgi:hypothetical protein